VNGVFSTQLSGTQVFFNETPAPLLYTSATAIAAVVPYAVAGTAALVTVNYKGGVSNAFAVAIAPSAPALFSFNASGAGQAAAVNADSSINSAVNLAQIGSILSLYSTGGGQTSPPGEDGQLAPLMSPFPMSQLPVSVKLGGQPAAVVYAGAAPGEIDGLMQVVIQVPAGVSPGGFVPVVLTVGASSTVAGASWIAVASPASSN